MLDSTTPPISLANVARRCGIMRKDRPVSPTTVARWINRGILTQDGRRVRLAALRIGRTWAVTEPALHAFFAALNNNIETATIAPAEMRSPIERKQAHGRAAKAVDAILAGNSR